jgi:hypothetical protein
MEQKTQCPFLGLHRDHAHMVTGNALGDGIRDRDMKQLLSLGRDTTVHEILVLRSPARFQKITDRAL